MSPISFARNTADNGQTFVTAFVNGAIVLADDTHPNYAAITGACAELMDGYTVNEQDFADLFDVAGVVERKFARLSERVTVDAGQIMFDGDPCQPALSKQILRFMDEQEDFAPLVCFMEKIQSNPEPHSRDQAFAWLNNHDFTITADGDVIAYKGVNRRSAGGYESGFSGSADVNDVRVTGRIPYAVGDVVTMPRSAVMHDPNAACHAGLHVGTYDYASMYATRGCMMEVTVNPRDIVSVPHHAAGEKIRVCRFSINKITDEPVATALYGSTTVPAPVEPAALSIGDIVVCAYYDYGTGNIQSIDEDGDYWVDFNDADYPMCMAAHEIRAF